MNIQDFLSPNDVTIDVAPANKQKLLVELANKAGSQLRLPPDTILTELSKREELGSTGVGDGVAIPHARFSQIDKAFGMLLRLRQPIEFDALDGKPIDNRVAAVLLPVWLLRIRTKSLLRTALRPRVERLRLGASLLVMN
jgi:nitrogen PTS system EIIA component